jgi:hypothetical protein
MTTQPKLPQNLTESIFDVNLEISLKKPVSRDVGSEKVSVRDGHGHRPSEREQPRLRGRLHRDARREREGADRDEVDD